MASELSKIGLAKVDKLCDAKWVKTIFNTSKKEFAQFVEQTSEVKDFMKGVEDRIDGAHEELRDLIRKYLERVTIKEQADQFKSDLKEAERERRRLKKKEEAEAKKNERELMKEELRKELLAEMDDSKEKAALEEKVGVMPRKKISFKKNDIRNRDDEESASESEGSSLKMTFIQGQDEMEGTRKKVVFKKGGASGGDSGDGKGDGNTGGRKMDLATLSAFISKTAEMGHLGIQDQNQQELPLVSCSLVKNMIQMSVQVDFESMLGSMIREGKFKMKNSRGEDIDVVEMSIGGRGKIELIVE